MALPKYPNLLLFLFLGFTASYVARTSSVAKLPSGLKEWLHRYYWVWALAIYWTVSFSSLYFQPLSQVDGYGSVPALWWTPSHPPETDFHGGYYFGIHWYPQLWVTALAMTLLGAWLTLALTSRWPLASRHIFTSRLVVGWLFLLLIWVAADIGTRLEIVYVGVIALEPDVFSTLFSITAAPAVLSGVLALAQRQLQAQAAGFESAAI